MGRKIELQILEEGVKAIAELYEKDTPKTCEALWSALQKPIENEALHTPDCVIVTKA